MSPGPLALAAFRRDLGINTLQEVIVKVRTLDGPKNFCRRCDGDLGFADSVTPALAHNVGCDAALALGHRRLTR